MLPSTQQRTNGQTDVKNPDMSLTYLDVTGLEHPFSQISQACTRSECRFACCASILLTTILVAALLIHFILLLPPPTALFFLRSLTVEYVSN